MAEVAADVGIDHIVFSTVAGVGQDTGLLHIESKATIEQRIRELNLPATIIRPVFFMHNFEAQLETILNGTLAYPLAEGVSWQLLDVRDLGMLTATALANSQGYVGEVIELAGDEHTLESAAEVFTAVTGTEVDPQHVPTEVAREELIEELGKAVGEDLASMFEWHNTQGFHTDIEALERNYDCDLTRLETYLREHDWEQ